MGDSRMTVQDRMVQEADLVVTTDGQVLKCRYAAPDQFRNVLVVPGRSDDEADRAAFWDRQRRLRRDKKRA